jgi:hypothetical protein
MVRSRARSHLDAIMKLFPDLLGACEVREAPGTDYAHRIFVAKQVWRQVVNASTAALALLDLSSFRGATAVRAVGGDPELADVSWLNVGCRREMPASHRTRAQRPAADRLSAQSSERRRR